jgi:hypothetical protein
MIEVAILLGSAWVVSMSLLILVYRRFMSETEEEYNNAPRI